MMEGRWYQQSSPCDLVDLPEALQAFAVLLGHGVYFVQVQGLGFRIRKQHCVNFYAPGNYEIDRS